MKVSPKLHQRKVTMQAEKIARCSLEHYKTRLVKGKPKPGGEWTVFAAIVAERTDPCDLWVVSCATGTKCTAHRLHGCVLHDCHAEILARRGLLRALWMELDDSNKALDQGRRLLEPSDNTGKYRLRSNLRFHLYLSCSPCGDATIYPVTGDKVMLHTGAKVIVSNESGVDASVCGGEGRLLRGTSVAREEIQVLGKLRTKSGRSNLPAHLRSTSMSCCDKIVQWGVLGLQGGLLSGKIDLPIFLSSIVVSNDPRVNSASLVQQEALQRAIPDRIDRVYNALMAAQLSPSWQICIPSVCIVAEEFPSDKAIMESKIQTKAPITVKSEHNQTSCYHSIGRKRKRDDDNSIGLSPCGISLLWQCCDASLIELIVGARGIRQGKKPKSDLHFMELASCVSRRAMVGLAQQQYKDQLSKGETTTYQQFKCRVANPEWQKCKADILKTETLAGWLKNSDEADFMIN